MDSWYFLHYFQNEALRRCATVHRLYKKNRHDDKALFLKYGVTWKFMVDSCPSFDDFIAEHEFHFSQVCCFYDMNEFLKGVVKNEFWKELIKNDFLKLGESILNSDRNSLFLLIDVRFRPKTIINRLEPILKSRYQEISKNPTLHKNPRDPDAGNPLQSFSDPFPWHPVIKSPIKDLKAWLKYLQCYDLRRCEGLAYGEIAKRIYGNIKKRDNAETAFSRVQRLIDCAEKNEWPPTGTS